MVGLVFVIFTHFFLASVAGITKLVDLSKLYTLSQPASLPCISLPDWLLPPTFLGCLFNTPSELFATHTQPLHHRSTLLRYYINSFFSAQFVLWQRTDKEANMLCRAEYMGYSSSQQRSWSLTPDEVWR